MLTKIKIKTHGEKFYTITDEVKTGLGNLLGKTSKTSGVLVIQCAHTSCGVCISESFDPSAKQDMENFLKHLAPRDLSFITHTAEGSDDSPSHMKSIVLGNDLSIIIEDGKMLLGTWQGIYLGEFRDDAKTRTLYLKLLL